VLTAVPSLSPLASLTNRQFLQRTSLYGSNRFTFLFCPWYLTGSQKATKTNLNPAGIFQNNIMPHFALKAGSFLKNCTCSLHFKIMFSAFLTTIPYTLWLRLQRSSNCIKDGGFFFFQCLVILIVWELFPRDKESITLSVS
jgi:hypothetical protein